MLWKQIVFHAKENGFIKWHYISSLFLKSNLSDRFCCLSEERLDLSWALFISLAMTSKNYEVRRGLDLCRDGLWLDVV